MSIGLFVLLVIILVVLPLSVESLHKAIGDTDVTIEQVKKFKRSLLGLLCIAFVTVAAFSCFTTIPANTVGIKYSPLSGGVQDTVLGEGLVFKAPWDTVYEVSTETQSVSLYGIPTQTKDSQFITSNVELKYRVSQENAFEVFKQFRTLENVNSNLLGTATQRVLELITTEYNVIEVLGEKRGEIYSNLEEALSIELEKSGIELWSVTLADTDAGAAIEIAIEQEAVAKKAVETAEQERLKAEIDAQVRVVEAQADLDKSTIEAQTKIVEAEAESKANQLISSSITQGLIDKIEAEARMEHGWVEIITQGSSMIVDTTN